MKILKIILIVIGILVLFAFVIGPMASNKLDSLEKERDAQRALAK